VYGGIQRIELCGAADGGESGIGVSHQDCELAKSPRHLRIAGRK